MTRPRPNQKPTFLWQALLIVLPVAVLAVFGFLSLRQDRILAHHEAAERAQAIADELVPRIWTQLTALKGPPDLEHNAFQVDREGNLIFPPPYPAVPIPQPFNLAALTETQTRLWARTQRANTDGSDPDAPAQADRDFIASNPPDSFAAAAWYSLGLKLASQGKHAAAVDAFETVLEKYPAAVTEGGLPLARFAELKLVQLDRDGSIHLRPSMSNSRDSFCSNAVYQPAFLTPYLLNSVGANLPAPDSKFEIGRWQLLWNDHESSRALFAAARPFIRAAGPPKFFWFTIPLPLAALATVRMDASANAVPLATVIEDRDWLAVRHSEAAPIAASESDRTMSGTMDVLPTTRRNIFEVEAAGSATAPGMRAPAFSFICRGQSEISAELATLASHASQAPEYFGIGLEVAGRKVSSFARDLRVWREVSYTAKGASGVRREYSTDLATTILGSASKTEGGADLLKVNVYLTSPATLFKRQTTRTFWFGSLIAASAAAALLGLLAAWRAFHRQLQLSEMKSNFVASVSHELRAPIASVRLMAESLERGKVSEPQKQNEYFRFIGQESRRLSSLIENVLDFSRIEQGRKQYEFEPTDVLALTQQTVKLMETYATERQIGLVFAVPDSQPATINYQLSADGRALQQALVNLLDNAIKHSPTGATVTVGLEIKPPDSPITHLSRRSQTKTDHALVAPKSDAGGSRLHLWVEDIGCGIPPEEHEKIFERFYRLGSELRRETQGVGIGLSLVKHIVEAHGGRVQVRSAVGEGSRFTIELPMQYSKENDE